VSAPGRPAPAVRARPAGAGPGQPVPYVMTPLEVAWGWVPGLEPEGASPDGPAESDPVRALEAAIRPALRRPPCVVQFSGGRDSSLVLAAALRLARREGLEEPVACTHVFPGLEETAESHWQELVVGYLGLRHWERVEVGDELDLIGPACAPSLRSHGLLWPPMVHGRHFDLRRAAGGALLDGEGGDEVLGAGRLAVVSALARGRLSVGKVPLEQLAVELAPRLVRRAVARRLYRRHIDAPWLRREAWRRLETALSDDFAGEPLDRRRSLQRHLRLRLVSLFLRNSAVLAAEHDVLDVKPLLDVGFVRALGVAGGRLGFPGRTSAMVGLFGDLLPADLLRRSTKARFNRVAFNVHSRAFAASWDGGGLDDTLVDADALRRCWAETEPNALSFGLLQAAWLAASELRCRR
jgi:hypothetical protein